MCRLSHFIATITVGLWFLIDATNVDAARVNQRQQRPARATRTPRSTNWNAGIQRASATLNAALAEQNAAKLNVVRARAEANSRYSKSTGVEGLKEEFEVAHVAYDRAKSRVLEELRSRDREYRLAVENLQAIDSGKEQRPAKSALLDLRLRVSNLERAALKQDKEANDAELARETASHQIRSAKAKADKAIANDPDIAVAKARTTQASRRVMQAQANSNNAVASARMSAQIAQARSRQRTYGSNRHSYGRRQHTSRHRRHR